MPWSPHGLTTVWSLRAVPVHGTALKDHPGASVVPECSGAGSDRRGPVCLYKTCDLQPVLDASLFPDVIQGVGHYL